MLRYILDGEKIQRSYNMVKGALERHNKYQMIERVAIIHKSLPKRKDSYELVFCQGIANISYYKAMLWSNRIPLVIIDISGFGQKKLKRVYFFSASYSLMDILSGDEYYSYSRLDYFVAMYNLPYSQEWINNEDMGAPILICPDGSGGWLPHNNGFRLNGSIASISYTLEYIRKYTDRPIVVRLHPQDRLYCNCLQYRKKMKKMIHQYPNAKLESYDKMDYLVKNVFGVVVDRSSIGIEFILRGIPVYHFFDDIHHSPFGMCDISLSADDFTVPRTLPSLENRRMFLEKIACQTWTDDEIKNGDMLDLLYTHVCNISK